MKELPPWGPRGVLKTTLSVAREPYAATMRWREQYGRTFLTRVASGHYFVTGEPAVVRDVFRSDPSVLKPAGTQSIGPLTGPRSLFVLAPREHSRERKLLAPPFHGGRMRAYAETMRDATERCIARWRVGQDLVALREARRISAEVIVRAVFGVRDPERVETYLRQIAAWVDSWKPAFILVPLLQRELFGLSPWARFVARGRALDALIAEEIAARRASGERGDDILSLLLETTYDDGEPLTDDSLSSHLRTLLFAGHETTMIGMAWVLHYVLRDASLLERTLAVLERPFDEVLNDPWLDAVVHEALRIYPIILGVVRELDEDLELGPYRAPAGTNVWVSIAMLHSDPELYPEPLAYRPERFLARMPKPYEYAPFGGGHRRCLGAAFAELETKIAVATLLGRTVLEHRGAAEPGTVRRNLSMAPAGGVPLRVRELRR
jgi:cytochrome P450 family 110